MEQITAELAEDKELIRRYLAGDASAFEVLYSRYRKPLYAFLNRLVENQTEADDLFQQTWLKAIGSLTQYQDRQKFFSWLSMIAHNLVMDYFRKRKRNAEQPLDDAMADVIPSETNCAWEQMSEAEFSAALEQAVRSLPEEQREVVALRRAGLSFKEIAEVQNCPLNTALGRMNYALKTLRKLLSGWRNYELL